MLDYNTRFDMIVTNAWETWTKNGINLDEDMRRETEKTVLDAVTNTYVEDITDTDWLAATLKCLNADADLGDDPLGDWHGRNV